MEALGTRADDWRPAVFALACATLAVGSVSGRRPERCEADPGLLVDLARGLHPRRRAGRLRRGRGLGAVLPGRLRRDRSGQLHGGGRAVGANATTAPALDTLAGLGTRRPALALGLTILLLAQAGVPFTSGFVAKFSVIAAAVEARSYWLAVVAMVSAVVAAFAYLRVVVAMYFRDSDDESETGAGSRPSPQIGLGAAAVIVVAVLVTVAMGVVPGVLESLSSTAAGL